MFCFIFIEKAAPLGAAFFSYIVLLKNLDEKTESLDEKIESLDEKTESLVVIFYYLNRVLKNRVGKTQNRVGKLKNRVETFQSLVEIQIIPVSLWPKS